VSSHRADHRAAPRRSPSDGDPSSDPSATGPIDTRRRAGGGTHATPRQRGAKPRTSTILSLPTLVGATALTLAAAGALTVSTSQADSPTVLRPAARDSLAQPVALDGASSISRAALLAGRERAVSRDSRRQVRQSVAARSLQSAAERQARKRDAALAQIAAGARTQARLIARNAWQLPVSTGAYHLTSRFGECSALWSNCHTGLDFAAPDGTPIRAIANGTITETASAGAYGNRTIQTLEDGTQVWYCHQSSFSAEVGDRVTAGEVIGAVGSTGNSTGPHLHFEIRPDTGAAGATDAAAVPVDAEASADASAGEPVDPFTALREHGLNP
jgi:murein DD-endopeptidase MepM/ murein hydrolase activator NlpD